MILEWEYGMYEIMVITFPLTSGIHLRSMLVTELTSPID